ncbi:MAG: M48 family metalloprotease [Deltaproteobacteria bacterium]|jgi:Zn-dependent protease with chaperone function|nr:M48 family metalloprotease [Deltaproteobacteria bacterium]
MYNQLIYFIVVLLLFSTLPSTGKPPVPSWPDALYSVVLFCFFVFNCRRTFARLQRSADESVSHSVLTRAYFRAETLLSITAIGFIAVYLYGLNLGAYLSVIPGYTKFTTVSGFIGLAIYMLHLVVVWYFGQPVHEALSGARSSRAHFIKGHVSFTSVILVPWFLISISADLLELIKAPAFMASDFAQLAIISIALFAFVLFGPWLIIRMWGCKPLPQDFIKNELQSFCDQHDFKTGGLLIWPLFGSEVLTAGVVGILPRLRYVLITSGLLRTLDIGELKAVIAHEMGHVRKKHLLFFVVLLILFVLLILELGDTVKWLALSNGTIFNWSVSTSTFTASMFSLLSALPIVLAMVLFLRFVFGYFLRNSERQADLYAMELVGDPEPLISSLQKIAFHSGRIEDLPSWHHYSIRQRVDFLVEAFRNRNLIRRHNRKLYGSALLFTAVIAALLFANWSANKAGLSKDLRTDVKLLIVERSIARDPGNVEYLSAYGALLCEKGRYSQAESVLRSAIAEAPDNASALNNLAWLYATGPYSFRHPEESLKLALKAATLDPAPDILDTLAEAYFVNGRYAEAVSVIDDALAEGGNLRNYLLKEKEKFEKALAGQLRVT